MGLSFLAVSFAVNIDFDTHVYCLVHMNYLEVAVVNSGVRGRRRRKRKKKRCR